MRTTSACAHVFEFVGRSRPSPAAARSRSTTRSRSASETRSSARPGIDPGGDQDGRSGRSSLLGAEQRPDPLGPRAQRFMVSSVSKPVHEGGRNALIRHDCREFRSSSPVRGISKQHARHRKDSAMRRTRRDDFDPRDAAARRGHQAPLPPRCGRQPSSGTTQGIATLTYVDDARAWFTGRSPPDRFTETAPARFHVVATFPAALIEKIAFDPRRTPSAAPSRSTAQHTAPRQRQRARPFTLQPFTRSTRP